MKKIISLITILFIYMLSLSAPAYAGDEKATTEQAATAATAEAATTDKKKEEEEPDCD